MARQCADAVFDFLGQLAHGDAGFCNRLHVLADLAMDFGGFAIVVQEIVVHLVHGGNVTNFFGRAALKVVIVDGISHNLTLGIWLIVKEIGEGGSRRSRLLRIRYFTLLLLLLLVLEGQLQLP